jgi:hypothetical protein
MGLETWYSSIFWLSDLFARKELPARNWTESFAVLDSLHPPEAPALISAL